MMICLSGMSMISGLFESLASELTSIVLNASDVFSLTLIFASIQYSEFS